MASTFSNLGLNLQGTGDNAGTWGAITNVNLQDIDNAIAGVVTVTVTGNTTLAFTTNSTSTTYTDEAGRNKTIILSGSLSATTVTITVPNIEKDYYIINNSGATTIISSGGSTTVSIATGSKNIVVVNPSVTSVISALPTDQVNSPGGTTNAVQYNSAGSFAGSTNLTFDNTTLAIQTATALRLTVTSLTAINTTTTSLAFTTATGGTATLTTANITTANVTTANVTSLTAVTATATTANLANVNVVTNGVLKIYNTANTQYTGLQVLAAAATTVTFTLPSSDGTSNQALVTNGSGTLSFSSISGGFSGATENASTTSALTLTSASTQYQKVQISSLANSYVTLPSATTMSTKGTPVFVIFNASPIGVSLDIKNNAGTILTSIPSSYTGFVTLIDNSTANGTWQINTTPDQVVIDISSTVNSNTPTNTSLTKVIHLTSTKLLVANFYNTGANLTMYTKIGDLSGSTITFGSQQSTTIYTASADYYRADICRLSDSAFILMWGAVASGGAPLRRVSVNTVSGTTITFGAQNALSLPAGNGDDTQARAAVYNGICCRMDDTKFAVVYNTGTTSAASNYVQAYSGSLTCNIITTSGTTLTVGTKVDLATSTFTQPTTLVSHDTDKLCVVYYQNTSATNGTGRTKVNIVSVSTRTPTWGTSVNVESADIADVGQNLIATESYGTGTSLNNCYGVALSTTLVLGIGGGSTLSTSTMHILISISGTTPTIVTTKNFGLLPNSPVSLPPVAINSTTVYQPLFSRTGYYIYVSSSGIRASSYANFSANSPTIYNLNFVVVRGTSASTAATFYNSYGSGGGSINYIATGTLIP